MIYFPSVCKIPECKISAKAIYRKEDTLWNKIAQPFEWWKQTAVFFDHHITWHLELQPLQPLLDGCAHLFSRSCSLRLGPPVWARSWPTERPPSLCCPLFMERGCSAKTGRKPGEGSWQGAAAAADSCSEPSLHSGEKKGSHSSVGTERIICVGWRCSNCTSH